MKSKPKVLIICTGNSMRSQIAEGVLRADLGDQIDVFSAGTHPSFVSSQAIETLAEIGIDASHHRSKSVNEFLTTPMDLVITVCDSAEQECPFFPNAKKRVHVPYPDPTRVSEFKDPQQVFAELRDQIRDELRELVIKELNLKPVAK